MVLLINILLIMYFNDCMFSMFCILHFIRVTSLFVYVFYIPVVISPGCIRPDYAVRVRRLRPGVAGILLYRNVTSLEQSRNNVKTLNGHSYILHLFSGIG